ncbi:ParB/RepB/Spo0J family partition protein, partial [Escherichia coli]
DRNRSHWSTSKTPSYTKSVSWQHHPLKLRLKGYLPVTCLEGTRNQRIAATIRHNRARGRHQITAMSEIVRELSQLGWDDNKIGKELGMDSDEVLRLKQINGLQELFADRQYSRAWTVK